MGWANDAAAALKEGHPVTVRPRGGSMRGRVEDNEEVTLEPVAPHEVQEGDVVFVRWKSGYLLHLVREARERELLIGNNLGKINGWVSRAAVLGRLRAPAP
jgi:hypothetical protein